MSSSSKHTGLTKPTKKRRQVVVSDDDDDNKSTESKHKKDKKSDDVPSSSSSSSVSSSSSSSSSASTPETKNNKANQLVLTKDEAQVIGIKIIAEGEGCIKRANGNYYRGKQWIGVHLDGSIWADGVPATPMNNGKWKDRKVVIVTPPSENKSTSSSSSRKRKEISKNSNGTATISSSNNDDVMNLDLGNSTKGCVYYIGPKDEAKRNVKGLKPLVHILSETWCAMTHDERMDLLRTRGRGLPSKLNVKGKTVGFSKILIDVPTEFKPTMEEQMEFGFAIAPNIRPFSINCIGERAMSTGFMVV